MIDGKNYNIKVTPPAGYLSDLSEDNYELYVKRLSENSVNGNRTCGSIGDSWPINYTFPNITITINTSNLKSGEYTGFIPLYMGYAEYHTASSVSIKGITSKMAKNYLNSYNVPYSITITNSCSYNPKSIDFNYGEIDVTVANNYRINKEMKFKCSENATIDLTLKPLIHSSSTYSDGVGVKLGSGWDAVLSISDIGLSDITPAKTVNLVGNVDNIFTFSSILRRNENATVGMVNGGAVLNFDIK
ncbi:hypothetical protein E1C95_08525 [Salmonella enterica subsp. enterica serovar Bonariensis]|nr:hypothetical protein [Salmonella enterica subsp. enterica serovar Bonariensis]